MDYSLGAGLSQGTTKVCRYYCGHLNNHPRKRLPMGCDKVRMYEEMMTNNHNLESCYK